MTIMRTRTYHLVAGVILTVAYLATSAPTVSGQNRYVPANGPRTFAPPVAPIPPTRPRYPVDYQDPRDNDRDNGFSRQENGEDPDDDAQYKVDCPSDEKVARIFVRLHQINADLKLPPDERTPIDCSQDLFTIEPTADRGAFGKFMWGRANFCWAATDFYHKPLYWDCQPLERYGQSPSPMLQPFISGAHFFATFPIIPYKIGVDRVWDPIYTLGMYRPGSYAPCLGQRLPWEWDAAAFQALAVTGFVFIFP